MRTSTGEVRYGLEFKSKLTDLLSMIGPLGEDGGLLIHPDGSAHIIDDEGDECGFFDDVMDDIDEAMRQLQAWERRCRGRV